jgi:hypothetical protein
MHSVSNVNTIGYKSLQQHLGFVIQYAGPATLFTTLSIIKIIAHVRGNIIPHGSQSFFMKM